MELGKESKMVGMALTVLLVFVFCGPATAQDLPPEILADQYMMEGVTALERVDAFESRYWPVGSNFSGNFSVLEAQRDAAKNLEIAVEAFGKIGEMSVEPPATFTFFYGQALVRQALARQALVRQALARQALVRQALARQALARQALARQISWYESYGRFAQMGALLRRQMSLLFRRKAEADDMLKRGQSLLKWFVINTGRGSEHYSAALHWLSESERIRD